MDKEKIVLIQHPMAWCAFITYLLYNLFDLI